MEIPASSPDLFRLEGQVALVTGGSKGLGEAMATALSGAGADVVISSRNLDECQAVSQQISRHTGGRGLALQADVSDLEFSASRSFFGSGRSSLCDPSESSAGWTSRPCFSISRSLPIDVLIR